MKFTIRTNAPRNPLVMPSRLRKAGSHRPQGGSHRQQAGRALQREIERLKQSP